MIYILFVWVVSGCGQGGVCNTMPSYSHAYATEKACTAARLEDDNFDRGAFCVKIPKGDLK